MNMTKNTWLRSLSAILLAFFSTAAQERNKSPELAVQVEAGQEVGFEIPAFEGGGGSTANFRLIKSKPDLEKSYVRELNFSINREGEVVIIHLSVKLANEKEVPVGTYRLRCNESTTAQELSNVGVEPVSLRVVNAKPTFVETSPPIQPLLDNRTRAVEVVNFYRSRQKRKSLPFRKLQPPTLFMRLTFFPIAYSSLHPVYCQFWKIGRAHV